MELVIHFLPHTPPTHTIAASNNLRDLSSDHVSMHTEHAILSSLASVMPNVTHLGVTEGLPRRYRSVLSLFQNISSIEQLVAQEPNGSAYNSGWYLKHPGARRIPPSLTTYMSSEIWKHLPHGLTTLTCYALPLYKVEQPCGSLRCLHLTKKSSLCWEYVNRFCILDVCKLLKAAPCLTSFSAAFTKENTFYGGMCMQAQLTGMQTLHTHICEGGLVIGSARGGVPVTCKSDHRDDSLCLSLSQLLKSLPSFPEFSVCKLALRTGESAAGCLSELSRVFPCLQTLILERYWEVSELLLLSDCTSLRRLEFTWNSCIQLETFCQIALLMPWLDSFVLHGG